jgi:putative SOS response-associated peptidase YedK
MSLRWGDPLPVEQTPDANELVAEIHDWMPLILAPGDYDRWLIDDPDPGDLLWPFPADPMWMWPMTPQGAKPTVGRTSPKCRLLTILATGKM